MIGTELKRTIEKYFDAEETKKFVIKALKTPHSNTRYWEREPQLHYYIQRVIQPLFNEVGLKTWVDDCGHLIIKMGKGKTGKKVLNIQHTMAWGAAEDEAEYNEASPLHKTGEVVDAELRKPGRVLDELEGRLGGIETRPQQQREQEGEERAAETDAAPHLGRQARGAEGAGKAVHGEEHQAEPLRQRLLDRGCRVVHIPDQGQAFSL